MADFTIEIFRSLGGLSEHHFTQVATFDNDGSTPFTWPDTPVTPGQLYIYKARRKRTSDSAYSDWSNLKFAYGPYPEAGAPIMADTFTGLTAVLARGNAIEATSAGGAQVKATELLHFTGHNFNTEMGRANSVALMNSYAAVTDETPARSLVRGPVSTEMRLARYFLCMLMELYGEPTETVITAETIYALTFSPLPTSVKRRGTYIYKNGDNARVFPGAHGNSITVAGDVNREGDDAVMKADFEYMFLNALGYSAAAGADLTALGLGTAAYTTAPAYGPKDWQMRVGGTVSGAAQTFNFNFNRNLNPEHIANLYLGPVSFSQPRSAVSLTAGLLWKDLNLFKQFWGLASGAGYPFAPTKNIIDTAVAIEWRPVVNADGLTPVGNNEIGAIDLVFPRCSIPGRTDPVEGDGPISESITFKPKRDAALNVDHYWKVITGISKASLIANSTLIPSAPIGALYPYSI
jgi:hypothetical protein